MNRTSLSIHPGIRIFPALAAALLLFLATGSSPAADLPAGSAPAATANVADPEAPAATDNVAIPEAPAVTDNVAKSKAPVATDNVAKPKAPVATDNGWLDRSHSWIEEGMFDTVVWFDRFFGDERVVIAERPEAYLRWKSEFRWDEAEHASFRSSVRAGVRLPRLQNQWHLVFTSESRGDPNAVIPEDPGNPGLDPGSQVRTSSTELVYDVFRTQRSVLDAGVGVQVKIPPNAFVRTRFQHARPLAFKILGRLTVTAYWDARIGFGESNQVDIERWLAPPTLLRWSNSFTIEENGYGWAWGTDLSLLHKFSPKSAITFSGGASGSTQPVLIAQNYRVLARYRRNVWRKWLFLEGEPEVHWPRMEDGSRKPVWSATLRAEVLFTGSELIP
ncbi:MAG: hypothetical protein H6R41_946 [Deltaproteobacteria bacterium]|nr:hypothetical protein [Deltaproteobacteria bacterium]MBS1244409.1 hypothetical protein [Deltaproteobacteria bacterium]